MKIDEHKKQFGKQAENYSKYRKPYAGEVYDLFFSLLPGGNKKVLDMACGTGISTEPLAKESIEVFGCDHDPLMIAEAQKQAQGKNLHINYAVAEAEHLPFGDASFDAITVGTAFHWFVNKKSMEEVKRVLKPQGLLFIFWTLTTKETPAEDDIPGSIFAKYGWERVPPELRDLDHISGFLTEHGLSRVKTARIPFAYATTIQERVGLQKTASAYELLSEGDKEQFLKEVTDVLTANLGDREHFALEEEIQVVYGFNGELTQ